MVSAAQLQAERCQFSWEQIAQRHGLAVDEVKRLVSQLCSERARLRPDDAPAEELLASESSLRLAPWVEERAAAIRSRWTSQDLQNRQVAKPAPVTCQVLAGLTIRRSGDGSIG